MSRIQVTMLLAMLFMAQMVASEPAMHDQQSHRKLMVAQGTSNVQAEKCIEVDWEDRCEADRQSHCCKNTRQGGGWSGCKISSNNYTCDDEYPYAICCRLA